MLCKDCGHTKDAHAEQGVERANALSRFKKIGKPFALAECFDYRRPQFYCEAIRSETPSIGKQAKQTAFVQQQMH